MPPCSPPVQAETSVLNPPMALAAGRASNRHDPPSYASVGAATTATVPVRIVRGPAAGGLRSGFRNDVSRVLLRMARRGRHVRAGGVRLGDRFLRAAGLSPRRAGGASLVGGAGVLGRDAALPGGRRRGRQLAGALPAVRPAGGDQERRDRPGPGRAGLGSRARAVGAAAGHAAERRRLGGDGRCRGERHHRAVVRAQTAGGARHGL